MAAKIQLDFILNPVEGPPPTLLLPSLPNSFSRTSDTLKAAIGWHQGLTDLGSRCKRDIHPPSTLVSLKPCKKMHTILPLTTVASPTADSCMSAATSSESEHSDLDSPKKTPMVLKKKAHLCQEEGCKSLAVSRRSCVRHGGGSRCTFKGCTNGAKLRNRCFQHGGSTTCLAAGCNSKAKRYGYCWSHGGGRICSVEGCNKVAAQGGLCWAHGGGNRCKVESCRKRSYRNRLSYHGFNTAQE
uniref:WRKY19-like zinc finger domain-containing protein n=1 Tax=Hyaloperonospora arabidopsidis (strain Emoy2) TaxID=559515 RepID=M4BPX2_HYAAE